MTAAYEDDSAELLAEWQQDLIDERLNRFLAKRPAAFAPPGWLNADVHAWLESLVRGEARTLVIAGPTGTGKSWSLWKGVETLIRNGWRGRWDITTAYHLSRIIAPPVDEDMLHRLAECELLCLDDIGSMRLSEWSSEHLLGIIDRRWSSSRPTIIATNLPDLRSLLGDRIASRLADSQVSVILNGPDKRRT